MSKQLLPIISYGTTALKISHDTEHQQAVEQCVLPTCSDLNSFVVTSDLLKGKLSK